jgi:hypothetical protein
MEIPQASLEIHLSCKSMEGQAAVRNFEEGALKSNYPSSDNPCAWRNPPLLPATWQEYKQYCG